MVIHVMHTGITKGESLPRSTCCLSRFKCDSWLLYPASLWTLSSPSCRNAFAILLLPGDPQRMQSMLR